MISTRFQEAAKWKIEMRDQVKDFIKLCLNTNPETSLGSKNEQKDRHPRSLLSPAHNHNVLF